ncbi:unnamed protein product [Aphanomyces euteiches]|uniref:Uncharacterized protein n=1 Tax=Aphanomyces euteiches TaxID=100861 RepID=A0A6G0XV59_9STRA|nr:hypothetical protein Ae201684_000826 [Aphanomyces euteiches]KAH9155290.1 hypothetical protein AeRB84_002731 [Aphanomyces euteiches]
MTASIVRGWEWAMHALWAEGDLKCNVRVVDTVFLDAASGQPTRWLFASKHGTIAKKKDDHLDLSSIRDRFLRLSMHPRNPNSYVAHALFRNGSRVLVNAAQFDELLFETPTKSRGLVGLQAHVVSAAHETLVASVKGSQCSVSSVGEPPVVSPRLRKEIELAATEIVRFLEATAHVSVAKLDAEFAVDDDNVLWLVHLAQVTTSDKKLAASQSLPTLHAVEKSDGGAKCRGEFCRVACHALPGLFPSAPQTLPPLEDTGQRFKIGYNNIALARLEMHFLHANAASNAEIALEWAAFDAAQRTELGRSNPSHFYKHVGVCANCNRIYAHLQTLRQNHFRHPDAADDHRLEAPPPRQEAVKKAKKKRFQGPPCSNNGEKSATDDVMPALLQLSQDQQHEAAFLAELAKHSTPRQNDVKLPEEEDAAPPRHERPPSKRKDGKKRAKGPSSAENYVLSHFQAEWNQVESANRSLVQENHDLRTQLELQERQHSHERHRLTQELTTALETNNVLEKQSKQLQKRIAAMQKELADAKDEMLQRRLLETDNKPATSSTEISIKRQEGGGGGGDQLSLIETIEQLTAQLDREMRERQGEMQKIHAAHELETARIYDRHKMETEALRMSIRQGVDALEELKTQLVTCQNQLHVAQTQTKQAKTLLSDAQHAKLALENQVAALEKQAIVATDAKAKATSNNDALEKLHHKIDYLKAQLASEIRCKEELGTTVATLNANLDAVKKERRKAVADVEDSHRKILERVQERHKQELEMLQTQNAALQGKLVQLQANVTDLVADLSAARNKEDNARLTTDKLAEESVRLHGRIAELELQNEELQEQVNGTKSSLEDAQRANLEATLRRLTHERQYLKNQMEGEARHKEDALAQCKELQTQLQDATFAWKQDVAAVKAAAKEREQALVEQLTKAQEAQVVSHGEATNARHQLQEIKLTLFKTREQAAADQTALEASRTDVAHLKASLIAAKDELLHERERNRQTSDRNAKAVQAVKASLVQVEQDNKTTITALQSDLQAANAKLEQTQASVVAMEQTHATESAKYKRDVALHRVVASMLERERLGTQRRWWQWRVHAQTHRALAEQGAKMANALKARESTWHERLHTACNELVEKAALEKELALAALQETLEKASTDKLMQLRAEHAAALQSAHDEDKKERVEALDALSKQHALAMDRLEEQHAETIHALQERARESQLRSDKALVAAVEEAQDRERRLIADANAARTQSLREMQDAHQNELKQLGADAAHARLELIQAHEQAMAQACATAQAEAAERAREADERGEMGANDWEMQWMEKMETFFARERQRWQDEHSLALQQLMEKQSIELGDVVQHWTSLLSHERATHAANVQELRQAFDAKLAAEMESCRQEMLEQKGSAVMSTTAKWQRALADTNARLDVEKKVAYDKGVADREAEWQKAAALIKQAQKDEIAALERDSKRALDACEEKFELQLAAKTAEIEHAFAAKLVVHDEDAQADMERAVALEREHMQAKMEEAIAAVVAEWREKLQAQKIALEEELQKACKETEAQVRQDCNVSFEAAKMQWEAGKAHELAKLQSALREEFATTAAADKSAFRIELDAQVQKLEAEWAAKLEAETTRLSAEAAATLQEELRVCADAAAKQHEEEIAFVQEESEKLIEKVETAMQQLKKQKETTEQELKSVQQALEEAEDASFDLQEEMTLLKKQHVFHHMMLLHAARKKMQHFEDEIDSMEMEKKTEIAAWEQKLDETTRALQAKLESAFDTNSKLEQVYSQVYETLVNYKRDELVAHRSASNVVTSELGVLALQIAEVSKTKADGEDDIQKAQAELGALEEELSAIQLMKDGHVNQAQVARKRRMHQEMEAMLESIETKRTKVRTVDAKLQDLHKLHKQKEDEMKNLERQLVQILVEQQKQLLALVTSAMATAATTPKPA